MHACTFFLLSTCISYQQGLRGAAFSLLSVTVPLVVAAALEASLAVMPARKFGRVGAAAAAATAVADSVEGAALSKSLSRIPCVKKAKNSPK